MRYGCNALLAAKVHIPDSMKVLTLIGFPLHRHLSTRFSRFCHRKLAPFGPNDGTTLLADLLSIPGEIYPAWGIDHYFRHENRARRLVTAVFQYLAESRLLSEPPTSRKILSPCSK
jgi:hypothetical protein